MRSCFTSIFLLFLQASRVSRLLLPLLLVGTVSINAYGFEHYQERAGRVVRLANEETHPYLRFGRKVHVENPTEKHMQSAMKKWLPSILRFQSVTDCLLRAERRKPQPDLTAFNWDAINSNEDAEVCLFRIASSYETPEGMEKWLKLQGFDISEYNSKSNENVIVSATLNLSENWPKYGSNFLYTVWIKIIAYSQSIDIAYDKNGDVFSVNIIFNIL